MRVLLLCVVLFLVGGSGWTRPDESPAVFRQTLGELSADGKFCLIAEGTPALFTDTEEQSRAILTSDDPAEAKLADIAELFGYSVEAYRGVYLLAKKYQLAYDLPCVTAEELRLFVRDAARLVSQVLAPIRRSEDAHYVRQLLGTLTEEQWTQAQGDGLPGSTLSPENLRAYQQLMAVTYFGNLRHQAQVFDNLLGTPTNASLIINPAPKPGQDGFGLSTTLADGRPIYLPFASAWMNPTTLQSRPVPESIFRWNADTLQQVAETLNRGANENDRYQVEESLRTKPDLVFGTEFATRAAVVGGITQLYGLRALRTPSGWRINRPAVPNVSRPSQLPDALRQITPAPLLRAQKRNYPGTGFELVRAYENTVAKQSGRAVSFAALTDKLQTAVSLFFFYEFANDLRDTLTRPLPPYLENPENCLFRYQAAGEGLVLTILTPRNGKWKSAVTYQLSRREP
jgi:hypothetical protein